MASADFFFFSSFFHGAACWLRCVMPGTSRCAARGTCILIGRRSEKIGSWVSASRSSGRRVAIAENAISETTYNLHVPRALAQPRFNLQRLPFQYSSIGLQPKPLPAPNIRTRASQGWHWLMVLLPDAISHQNATCLPPSPPAPRRCTLAVMVKGKVDIG